MEIIEQHVSPDGLLKFIVARDEGELCLGFEGYAWHTHPELLTSEGVSEEEGLRCFIKDLLESRLIIVISRVNNSVRNVWITDDPESDLKLKFQEETIEFRYWNGGKAV